MSARWAFVVWNNLSISLFAQNKSGRCIPASQQPASSTACIDLLSNAAEYHPILSFKKSNFPVRIIEASFVLKQSDSKSITLVPCNITKVKGCNLLLNLLWNWHSLSKSVAFEKWRKWVLDGCETWAGLHMVMVLVVPHQRSGFLIFGNYMQLNLSTAAKTIWTKPERKQVSSGQNRKTTTTRAAPNPTQFQGGKKLKRVELPTKNVSHETI